MQRIWNREELKSMPEWRRLKYGDWVHKDHPHWIYDYMVGRTLDSISSTKIVEGYMIAKEPILHNCTSINKGGTASGVKSCIIGYGNSLIVCEDPSIIGDGRHSTVNNLNKNNMETKEVTLNNGTVLEVGNTYEFDKCERGDYFTMLFIGDYKMAYRYNNSGDEVATSIDKNLMIIPYTPPTPQKEWKTFLIEFSGIKYRAILQYETLEQAQFHHPNAISITEVKINIEEVK